jgi:hypothetical protein
VFIDFDNIEIGVKNSLDLSFDAGLVLEALKERGEVVSKTAYSDWQRAGGYSRMLTQHAIKMVQRNLTPGGDKNGADINLALDALEMAFTHSHINAFVIVGGDSDFISLVEKLKQYDKKVFIVGGRQFTSGILQRNCHEFIAYEQLVGGGNGLAGAATATRRSADRPVRVERSPIEQAFPLVTRALKVLSEREVSPQLGLLKTILIQLDSTFSERTYGAGSFRDFAQKLERAGVLHVHQVKGGWVVAPADPGAVPAVVESTDEAAGAVPVDQAAATGSESPASQGSGPVAVIGSAADGVRALGQMLTTATVRRWPMYLRNVKQIVRQVNPSFDERAYGFANPMDLLRAAQKEGLLRIDRDRQGVVRVFQGPAFAAMAPSPQEQGGGPLEAERPPAFDDAVESNDAMAAAPSDEPSFTEPESTDIADADDADDSQIAMLGIASRDVPHDAVGAAKPSRRRPRAQPPGRSRSPRPRRAPKSGKL